MVYCCNIRYTRHMYYNDEQTVCRFAIAALPIAIFNINGCDIFLRKSLVHVSEFYGFLLKVNRLSAAIEFQPNLLWKIDNVLYFMSDNNFVDRIQRAVFSEHALQLRI